MYDNLLLDLANTYIYKYGRISKDEMIALIHNKNNTSIQKETLEYILKYYNCTASAINIYNKHFKC